MKYAMILSAVMGTGLLAGCNQPSLLPNSDPNLRRSSTQFAADAAKRHPYKGEAPRGGDALANAQFDLTFGTLQILNYSNDDWDDVEIWVNKKYVAWIPRIEKGKQLVKTINFQMLFDDSGNHFTTEYGKTPLQTVELYRNGKMYDVSTKMAD